MATVKKYILKGPRLAKHCVEEVFDYDFEPTDKNLDFRIKKEHDFGSEEPIEEKNYDFNQEHTILKKNIDKSINFEDGPEDIHDEPPPLVPVPRDSESSASEPDDNPFGWPAYPSVSHAGREFHNSHSLDREHTAGHFEQELASPQEATEDTAQTQHTPVALTAQPTVQLVADTGCGQHMLNDIDLFSEQHMVTPRNIQSYANENSEPIISTTGGTATLLLASGERLKLTDALYVPQGQLNLLSVGRLCKEDYEFTFNKLGGTIKDPGGKVVADIILDKRKNIYTIPATPQEAAALLADSSKVIINDIWRRRLGDIGDEKLKQFMSVLPKKLSHIPAWRSEVRVIAKQPVRSFNKKNRTNHSNDQKLTRLDTDLQGPITPTSLGGARFLQIIVDPATGYVFQKALQFKSDAADFIIETCLYVETQFGIKVKTLRSDNGGEFVNEALDTFAKKHGIVQELTIPHSPQQNGRAEVIGKLITEATRTQLIQSGFPKETWAEAAAYATALRNFIATTRHSVVAISPFERVFGKPPPLHLLKVYGCRALYHIPKPFRAKMDPKAREGTMAGIDLADGWRIRTADNKIVRTRTAFFFEDTFPARTPLLAQHITTTAKAVNPEDFETFTDSDDEKPEVPDQAVAVPDQAVAEPDQDFAEPAQEVADPAQVAAPKQASAGSRPKAWKDGNLQAAEFDRIAAQPKHASGRPQRDRNLYRSSKPAYYAHIFRPSQPYFDQHVSKDLGLQPLRQRGHVQGWRPIEHNIFNEDRTTRWNFYESDDDEAMVFAANSTSTPRNIKEALAPHRPDRAEWIKACNRELGDHKRFETFTLVEPSEAAGRVVLDTMWAFKTKQNGDRRARWCIKGFQQQPGVDYDTFEVYAPTLKHTTFRSLLAVAAQRDLDYWKIDIVGAFQQTKMALVQKNFTHVYAQQPPGFEVKGKEHHICKITAAIQGLRQASRVFHEQYIKVLKDMGFTVSDADESLYHYFDADEPAEAHCAIHVDDNNVISTPLSKLQARLLKTLKSNFELTLEIEPKLALGITIARDRENGIFYLSQPELIQKIIDLADMRSATSVPTPAPGGAVFSKLDSPTTQEDKDYMSTKPFRSMLACMLYLTNVTKAEVMHTANKLAGFVNNPGRAHWKLLQHAVRYLIGSKNHALIIGKHMHPENLTVLKTCQNLNVNPETFLHVMTDSDFAADESKHSHGCHVIMYGGSLVSWQSCLQSCISLSTAEAEYIAASTAAKEVAWIIRLYAGFKAFDPKQPLAIFTDNQAAMAIAESQGLNRRTRHIEVRYHYIREHVQRKSIKLHYIPSAENTADIGTKTLEAGPFASHVRKFVAKKFKRS